MKGQYATLKDVAERAGTTAATVSYVLNGSGKRYISTEMRQRVEQAAKELNYVKSNAASSLKGQRRKIIAVLVPQFANQFFTQMVLGVEKVADRYGYILSICNTYDDPEREQDIINRMMAQRVDGYIITPSREGGKNTRQLRKMGVPMVIADRTLDIREPYFFVTIQNYESTHQAVEYLLKRGHRCIAYIGWIADFGGLELREKAYHQTMEEYGVPLQEHIVYNGEFTAESGMEMTYRALAEHPEITAIFYAYNIQARGGVDVLRQKGIRVGEELSVMLLGAPEWVQTGNNNFTCIDLNGENLGETASEMLFDIINHEETIQPYQKGVDVILMEGSSVCQI